MKLFILLTALTLIGCGRDDSVNVDSKYQFAVDLYLKHAPTEGYLSHLKSVEPGELPIGIYGICYIDGDERRIVINQALPETWLTYATVAHEMAHCVHGAQHQGNGLMSDTKVSIDPTYWEQNLESELVKLWR